jgi:hypothetical protein
VNSTAKPVQGELFPSIATQLDETGGLVVISDLETIGLDPERRSNITMMAGAIGVHLAEVPRTGVNTDRAFAVHRNDFYGADPHHLGWGLYMPIGDRRRQHARQLAVIGNEPCELELPGVVGRYDGVVVSEQEHIWIVRNALDMAKAVDAKTRRANADNRDCEELEEKAGRSVAHALEAKRDTLVRLDDELTEQRAVLWRINRDARIVWRTTYLAKDLDQKRRLAEELIHETARIACINLGHGTTVVNAIHRAITSDLYRRGSSRELSQQWKRYTAFVGLYTNAKRGKVDQSRQACERELSRHEHYLPAA